MRTDLKRKRQYLIHIINLFPRRDIVDGYPVVIHGFEDYQFFVHKTTTKNEWQISEAITGFGLPNRYNGKTRNEALKLGTAALNKLGKGEFNQIFKKALSFIISGKSTNKWLSTLNKESDAKE